MNLAAYFDSLGPDMVADAILCQEDYIASAEMDGAEMVKSSRKDRPRFVVPMMTADQHERPTWYGLA